MLHFAAQVVGVALLLMVLYRQQWLSTASGDRTDFALLYNRRRQSAKRKLQAENMQQQTE